MKTITKDNKYHRVDNETADLRVNVQGWKFCPKNDWKVNVRNFEKKRLTIEESKKEVEIQSVPKPKYQKPKKS